MISIITAMDKNGLIGKDKTLPWNIPEDLKYFYNTTKGNAIVMGRKTWESIGEKPLKNRLNIILTRGHVENTEIVTARYTHEIFAISKALKEKIFIIGGAEIYKTFYPYCDKLYITYVNDTYEGNIYFPIPKKQIDEDFVLESQSQGEKCEFLVMRRR